MLTYFHDTSDSFLANLQSQKPTLLLKEGRARTLMLIIDMWDWFGIDKLGYVRTAHIYEKVKWPLA